MNGTDRHYYQVTFRGETPTVVRNSFNRQRNMTSPGYFTPPTSESHKDLTQVHFTSLFLGLVTGKPGPYVPNGTLSSISCTTFNQNPYRPKVVRYKGCHLGRSPAIVKPKASVSVFSM
jgi:hypothetical protein